MNSRKNSIRTNQVFQGKLATRKQSEISNNHTVTPETRAENAGCRVELDLVRPARDYALTIPLSAPKRGVLCHPRNRSGADGQANSRELQTRTLTAHGLSSGAHQMPNPTACAVT